MIAVPDRWAWWTWAKRFLAAAYLAVLVAGVLDRAAATAALEADRAVRRHTWDAHDDGGETDD